MVGYLVYSRRQSISIGCVEVVVSELITITVREEANYSEFWRWCNRHCRGRFYTGTNWDLSVWRPGQQNRIFRRIVQFELETDATMFALRWS